MPESGIGEGGVALLESRIAEAEARIAELLSIQDAQASLGAASSARELVEIVACYLDPLGEATCSLLSFEGDEGRGPMFADLIATYPEGSTFPQIDGRLALHGCPYRSLLVSRDLLVIPDCEGSDVLDAPCSSALLAAGRRSLISVPLLLRGAMTGRLLVAWPRARALSASEVSMATAVARQAPATAERLRLLEERLRQIDEQKRSDEQREALQARVIEAQRALLEELGTPTIPVAEDVLLMPLVGRIDGERAQRIMDVLLSSVASRRASTALLDVSGVPSMDAGIADALLAVAGAVRLLGAEVILTGVRPDAARALAETMAGASSIMVRATVQDGIALAMKRGARWRDR